MTTVENPGQHYQEVHCSSVNSTYSIMKKEEDEDPAISTALPCMQKEVALKTQIVKDSQACPYCGDTVDTKDDISVHISTHHHQQRFCCSICENSQNTSCTAVFDKLDEAVEHMATVHQLEKLPAMITQARAASSPTTLCPVISSLSIHCPALTLPATPSQLIQAQCKTCLATALQISSEKLLQHGDDCTSKELVLQCRLCLVSLPDSGSDFSVVCKFGSHHLASGGN